MNPILVPTAEIVRFVLVLTRLSGIMFLAPFFGHNSIPMHIRIVFSMVTAFILAPSLPLNMISADLNLGNIAGVFINEIMFGVILGFAALCIFAGLQFAGQMISFMLGFSIINIIDPQTQVESPVFSFLYNYLGLLIFLMINGHHWFLLAINESFSVLPIGGIHIRGSLAAQIVDFSASILVIGIKIAAPIIAVTVIADIIIGIIGRTAPQINLLVVGMPMKLLIGFSCMSFSFYFLTHYLETLFLSLSRTLITLVHAMR
jgi:flagellar biosynthesis protein FliR